MMVYPRLAEDFLASDLAALLPAAQAIVQQGLIEPEHGDWPRWQLALANLPKVSASTIDLNADSLQIGQAKDLSPAQAAQLETSLREFHPWRKGPFNFFGVHIDTEWRSDWKWQRVAPHLSDLQGRRVLDVGCGSGYHVWRMLGAGAKLVLGVEPVLLYNQQFLAARNYLGELPAYVLPATLEALPEKPVFDSVFSMGILYHRISPLEHLKQLKALLRPKGELVLETLVIEGNENQVLLPQGRYAKMRNVWFLPSTATLIQWLQRLGFKDIRLVDVNQTSLEEQRSTDWMQFESLKDFLDPENTNLTLEGYPAPLRATIIARSS